MSYPRLYHFTCDHGHAGIGPRGALRPNPHPFLGVALVWLTTEANPDRIATGLGRAMVKCDRMAYRYRVVEGSEVEPVPWIGSKVRTNARATVLVALESYGDPEHWWISTEPIGAVLA